VFTHVVGPSKPVVGQVVDFDTGLPIADAVVRAYQLHGSRLNSSREREEYATRSDTQGRYRLTGLPRGAENSLVAFTTGDIPYFPIGHEVDTSRDEGEFRQEFRLKRGVWAEGRVFDQETGRGFTGELSYYFFRNPELEKTLPGLRQYYVDGAYWTNENGDFRVPVLPARGILAFRYDSRSFDRDGIDRYPRGYGAESIAGRDRSGGLSAYATLPYMLHPENYQRVAEVVPTEGQATIRVDMPLAASKPVTVHVVDAAGKPVTGYAAYGAGDGWGWQPMENTSFEIEGLGSGEVRKVFVFHRERGLAGGVVVRQGTDDTVKIELKRSGSITGRIVNKSGEPITDVTLYPDYDKFEDQKDAAVWADHPKLNANPSNIPVDKDGRFFLDGLIPGWKYNGHASAVRKFNGQTMSRIIGDPFEDVEIEPGEAKDLGNLIVDDK